MKTKQLKKYKFEIELVVCDPDAVIKAGRELYRDDDWQERVAEEDGDELFLAMDSLFNGPLIIPDKLAEAVEFYAGGSDNDGEVSWPFVDMPPKGSA